MADVLIRNLTDEVVDTLKAKAAENKRSLQAELKSILEREADFFGKREETIKNIRALSDAVEERNVEFKFDSTEYIRKLRDLEDVK